MPPHGEQAFIDAQHGTFLRALDDAATTATSTDTFRSAVTALSTPPAVLFVGFTEDADDDEMSDIVKTFDWSGHSRTVLNGYGAGTLSKGGDERTIMIYENSGPWDYMESFTVYIEHTETEETP